MQETPTDEHKRALSLRPGLVVIAIVLSPLLYALSSGPALWLTAKVQLPAAWWNVVYWPLTFGRDTVPGFHELLQWYLKLFTG